MAPWGCFVDLRFAAQLPCHIWSVTVVRTRVRLKQSSDTDSPCVNEPGLAEGNDGAIAITNQGPVSSRPDVHQQRQQGCAS